MNFFMSNNKKLIPEMGCKCAFFKCSVWNSIVFKLKNNYNLIRIMNADVKTPFQPNGDIFPP